MAIKSRLIRAVEKRWYGRPGIFWLLAPLEVLYSMIVALRRAKIHPVDIGAPVVVVGNLSVGGVGKTPIVIALVKALRAAGLRPGVVSRGYGREDGHIRSVSASSTPAQVGDEPLLIFEQAGCPVVVGADRVAAATTLLSTSDCNIVISDDGLQHVRLHRHINILVVDSSRGFGNGHCLPVGPLREPVSHLFNKDFVIQNGTQTAPHPNDALYTEALRKHGLDAHISQLQSVGLRNLITREVRPVSALRDLMPFTAVAAIGHPQRFFLTLKQALTDSQTPSSAQLGSFDTCTYPDHHRFIADDFAALADTNLVMTAKDAVKCRHFARANWWCLDVEATLPESVFEPLLGALNRTLAQYSAKPPLAM